MAMTERSRNALYEGLTGFIDPEAVGEMLSYFPARDVEEPATRELVRAECALVRADLHRAMGDLRTDIRTEVRGEMESFRTEIRGEMESFRSEVRGEMESFRSEVRGEMESFRSEIRGEVDTFRSEIRADLADLRTEVRSAMRWTIGAMVSLTGVLVAAMAALG